ncbi:sortase domain-bontaining protein [Nocardioides cavernaquae]|uniref:Class F sortase n=1 Tax=Nocardioides cavernaquae TaxID=2321396 RepID=A0A3A5H7I6_9ACTN|nr:sortase [Nocardioides cavernaquae]RJS45961.1 class F sortase [Nocardioides cavernaquae]
MTPTLAGRLQTRLALSLLLGVPVAVLAAIVLDTLTLGGALLGLVVITGLGLGWDLLHNALQERRWDGDWPRVFTLLSWLPEAASSWLVLRAFDAAAPLGTHLAYFTMVWGAVLLGRAVILPVLLPRWRHQGQRLAGAVPSTTVPATTPSPEAAPRQLGARTLFPRLQPTQQRLATLVLFVGVVASVVLLAPLLERDDTSPAANDPRLANGEGFQSTSKRKTHVHEDGDVHVHGPGGDAADGTAGGGAKLATWDTRARLRPAYVEFRAGRVATPLRKARMTAEGVLVTPDPLQAAWFGQGAAPGQRGPAVLIGSLDSVFAGLHHAKPGQALRVVRADGSQIDFTVDRVTEVDARSFPTQKVYGADDDPLLRLVGYDDDSGRNTIVFAHAVSMVESPAEG